MAKKKESSDRISDWIKKTVLTGMGAVFLTEEGIRNVLGEVKMPKNVVSAIINQADKTKREISKVFAHELRFFLDKIEVDKIIKKILEGQEVEINMKIKFNSSNK